MLWSLGATALAGVATIFAQGQEFLLRLLGTGAATAVAAGLMWPLTRAAEKPASRLAGLTGMAAVLAEFFLLLLLIWVGLFLPSVYFENLEIVGWAALFLPMTAAPAVIFLMFVDHPAGWLAARVGAVAAAVTFVELMIASWQTHRGFFPTPRQDWSMCALATAMFGSLCVACLAGTFEQRLWRWAGAAAAVIAWCMMSVHALQPSNSELGETIFTLVATLATLIAYLNLYSMPSLAPHHEIFRIVTFITAVLTAGIIDVLMLLSIWSKHSGSFGEIEGLLGRLAAAGGIVTACGTVAIMILALINRRHMTTEPYVAMSWVEMDIVCPACQRPQRVPLGESSCCECHLQFSIRIGERTA